jgi:hypothetical protein
MAANLLSYSKRTRTIIPILIVGLVVLSTLVLPHGDIKTTMLYAVLVPLFFLLKFDSRIIIGYAVVLLGISGAYASFQGNEPVVRLAILSYYLLVVGVVCLLIQFMTSRGKNI